MPGITVMPVTSRTSASLYERLWPTATILPFSIATSPTNAGPLALMGFCYLDFSTRLGRPGSKAKRIIIYVLIVLVPYRTNILALVGLMDRMLKTRTRFVPNDKAK